MTKDECILFWSGEFSQWYRANIIIEHVQYNCNEQFMMFSKAKLFGDVEMMEAIMSTYDPSKQKAMGRNVRNFDRVMWEKQAKLIVYRANFAKFTQNQKLKDYLLSTGNKMIVEASPTDTVWGIGLGAGDPRALDPFQWKGTNWLGQCIMDVREDIRTLEALR